MKKTNKSSQWKVKSRKKMSYSTRLAGMYLASNRFVGAFLALCIAVGSLAGCSTNSQSPDSSGQAVQEASGTQSPTSTPGNDPGTDQNSADPALNGMSGEGENTGTGSSVAGNESDPGSGTSESVGQAEASDSAFTLPYDASDPAEMASAHNWLCSDLVDNVDKLGDLTETEDFHAAVNREWLSSSTIPSGHISYDSFTERQLEVDAELLKILESNSSFTDPYIAHCQKLVRDYYKMWIDWDARDKAGVTPLATILQPLQDVSNLEEMSEYLSDPKTTIEALPLCSSFTAANPNDTTVNAVYISPPVLTFKDPKYYSELNSDSWNTQPRYIKAAGYMLERLGYSILERDTILKQSYEFECEMAKHMMTTEEYNAEDSSIRTNNPRTLEELQQEQGGFPLTGMLKGAGLDGSDVFILQEPEWLACMKDLYDEAHLDKMKSYLMVQDVLQFMELLDHDCYNKMIEVRNILSGSSGQLEDKKAACDAVNSVLEEELGDVYAATYVTDKTRHDVTGLINDAIDYYRVMIQNEDFLSDATKAEAVKKLDCLTIRVASPEEPVNGFSLMDDEQTIIASGSSTESLSKDDAADGSNDGLTANGATATDGSNGGLTADSAADDAANESNDGSTANGAAESSSGRIRTNVIDFLGPEEGGSLVDARIAISKNTTLKMASEVNQPVDLDRWIAAPQEVNAYYYPLDNSINIPAGILGGGFYSDEMSREEKLGHIGVMIGHEISHAFDTSGRQYDETGNLRNWWTEEDYIRFHARAQKLVDYYNGFEPIPGFKVNGAMLDTEAIADLAGVKCMLQIAADDSGFDYDLFFRTLASNWRNLTTIETVAYCIEQDSHPLSYLRTNAVVVQFEEFHRTYGTKEGDGMYLAPEYRLEVW